MNAKRTAVALVVLAAVVAVTAFVRQKAPTLGPAPRPSNVPLTWSNVRDLPGHAQHVGKKDIACRDCHAEADGGFQSLGTAACDKCHADQTKRTHAGSGAQTTTCLTCHAFAKPAATCISCHDEAQGKRAAISVHARPDAKCESCHMPHADPQVKQADCAGCHGAIKAAHGNGPFATDIVKASRHVGSMKGTCTDCHAPHTKAALAKALCASCHEDKLQGPKPSGHEACVTCHAPHDATSPKKCDACHRGKEALLATKVTMHSMCTSCHQTHDAKASPEKACATCHKTITASHAAGKADRCIDCHPAHPADKNVKLASAHGGALSCASCHTKAKSDNAFHAKNAACATCHEPHAFSLAGALASGTAFCAKCHAKEEREARASKGHASCDKCHGTVHETKRGPACASCHGEQARTAPAGHADCSKCHSTHEGRRTPEATCGSCHAQEAASAHAKVKGGCETCHRAHGPKGVAPPPACGTCHGSLPGLHRVRAKSAGAAHTECAKCHSDHGSPRADRASCTSCHADKRDHQPGATACSGCHVFKN